MLSFTQSKEDASFWTKTDIPLDILSQLKCNTYLKANFRKIGRIFQRSTYRTYYLFQNHLLYSDLNEMETLPKCKGFAYLNPVYVEFLIDGSFFIIKLIQSNQEVSLSTANEAEYIQWKNALSDICIMTSFLEDFKIGHFIGRGNFSVVHICESRQDQKKYAVKIIQRSSIKSARNKEQIVNEIVALRLINHINVLKAIRVYDSKQFVYIVTTLLEGGTLIQKTNDFKKLSIQEIRSMMKCLLEALAYIHENNILHRDIKPENIIFNNKNNPLELTIIDFGLAALTRLNRYSYMQCGSPGYTAPEVLSYVQGKKLYSGKCDVYSLGITFFGLFYGYNPFKCDDKNSTIKKNSEGYIYFPKDTLVPYQVQKLLENMLKKYPKERYNAAEALQDSFFTENIITKITFLIPKVIITKKQNDLNNILIKSAALNLSFQVQGTQNASHLKLENLYIQIRKYQSSRCIFSPHFLTSKKQNILSQSYTHKDDRPKSNTTGQLYYEFLQINSQNLVKQNFQLERDHWMTNKKCHDQQQQQIYRQVKVFKEDFKIKPYITQEILSTVQHDSQVHINSEMNNQFTFPIQVTPFQKYKSIGQIECLNDDRKK